MSNKIGMEVVMFFVENCEIHSTGQGVVGVTCNKLWDMDDEEFEKTFITKPSDSSENE